MTTMYYEMGVAMMMRLGTELEGDCEKLFNLEKIPT